MSFAGPHQFSIFMNVFMATSIHLPKDLLEALDRKARALRVSRNQIIVRALEREIRAGSDWSPGFFDQLAERDPDLSRDVDEMLDVVRRGRRSKRPRLL